MGELKEGRPARSAQVSRDERRSFELLGLLSSKPVLYVCNVDEASADRGNAYSDKVKEHAATEGAAAVVVSAKIESEIAMLPQGRAGGRTSRRSALTEPGLSRVIRAGYELFTPCLPSSLWGQKTRARASSKGPGRQQRPEPSTPISKRASSAPKPLPMTTMSPTAERPAREAGKFRLEGKDYVVADGDVMHFRFAN